MKPVLAIDTKVSGRPSSNRSRFAHMVKSLRRQQHQELKRLDRARDIPQSLVFQRESVMNASTPATPRSAAAMASSPSVYSTRAFWEYVWRTSGLQFVGLFIITSIIYGYQPQVGAAADSLVAFYSGERTRILLAATFSGLNLLNLLWFAAALRTTLADAGQDGWGAAATAASAAFGAVSLL